MTDQEWEAMREKIEALLIDHVNGFILIAEVEDENGKLSTVKMGTNSNAMAVGLARLMLHDVLYARDKAFEAREES